MTKLVYVAGSYRGISVKENIQNAERKSIELIRAGFAVITPHKNTAGYEKYEDGQKITHQTWLDMDLLILERCDILYVLKNSEESKGTQAEIAFAREHNIPIVEELK
jgi:hypothetical protein